MCSGATDVSFNTQTSFASQRRARKVSASAVPPSRSNNTHGPITSRSALPVSKYCACNAVSFRVCTSPSIHTESNVGKSRVSRRTYPRHRRRSRGVQRCNSESVLTNGAEGGSSTRTSFSDVTAHGEWAAVISEASKHGKMREQPQEMTNDECRSDRLLSSVF